MRISIQEKLPTFCQFDTRIARYTHFKPPLIDKWTQKNKYYSPSFALKLAPPVGAAERRSEAEVFTNFTKCPTITLLTILTK